MAGDPGGLGFLKGFAIGLFAVIIVIFMLVIISANLVTVSTTYPSATTLNESGYINQSRYRVANATVTGFGSFSITEVRNASDQVVIGAANYSYYSNGTIYNITSTTWGDVDIDYSYTYEHLSEATHLANNFTAGVATFGNSISTWLVLAGLVVTISIVVVVIVVVSRINGGSGKGESL